MKKFLSCFLFMFGFVMLCNLSHAATFTFEEGKYKVYAKYFADAYYDSYLTVLNDLENYEPNFTSPALPDLVIDDALLEKYPYIMFYDNTASGTAYQYLFILSDVPLLAVNGSNISTKGYLINGSMGNVTPKDTFTNYMYAYYRYGSWAFSSEHSVSDWTIVGGASSCKPIYYANYDVYHNLNNTLVYKASSAEEEFPSLPSAFKEMTNEQLNAAVSISLNSTAFKERPTGYDKFFITYHVTGEDAGFCDIYCYPSYAKLTGYLFEPGHLDDLGKEMDYQSYSIRYVYWDEYDTQADFENVFNGIQFYKITVKGGYGTEYISSANMKSRYFSCEDYPIIYTSHDIRFVHIDEEGNKTLDEINSIPSTSVKDEETGDDIIFELPEATGEDAKGVAYFLNSLFDGLKNILVSIFIPPEEDILAFKELFESRFAFLTTAKDWFETFVETIKNHNQAAPVIPVDFGLSEGSVFADVGSINCIDLSWYAPYKPVVDGFIIAFGYGFFLYKLFKTLPDIIGGNSWFYFWK